MSDPAASACRRGRSFSSFSQQPTSGGLSSELLASEAFSPLPTSPPSSPFAGPVGSGPALLDARSRPQARGSASAAPTGGLESCLSSAISDGPRQLESPKFLGNVSTGNNFVRGELPKYESPFRWREYERDGERLRQPPYGRRDPLPADLSLMKNLLMNYQYLFDRK